MHLSNTTHITHYKKIVPHRPDDQHKLPIPTPASSAYSSKQIRQNVEGYVFAKYINYIKNYEKVLEKKFPTAMQVYRVFIDGMKEFYRDMKLFLKITRITNTSALGLRSLTRKELELYHQMPKDMYACFIIENKY